ncbi:MULTISPECIES: hypothetical protein [Burkholderia]|uniref:hypothetical protein n=1 Tax=Burkholderia TaxID=32008 RepID=UPI000A48418F|nr:MULTISPECIES: hypothetical protein [Burkholderia]
MVLTTKIFAISEFVVFINSIPEHAERRVGIHSATRTSHSSLARMTVMPTVPAIPGTPVNSPSLAFRIPFPT